MSEIFFVYVFMAALVVLGGIVVYVTSRSGAGKEGMETETPKFSKKA